MATKVSSAFFAVLVFALMLAEAYFAAPASGSLESFTNYDCNHDQMTSQFGDFNLDGTVHQIFPPSHSDGEMDYSHQDVHFVNPYANFPFGPNYSSPSPERKSIRGVSSHEGWREKEIIHINSPPNTRIAEEAQRVLAKARAKAANKSSHSYHEDNKDQEGMCIDDYPSKKHKSDRARRLKLKKWLKGGKSSDN